MFLLWLVEDLGNEQDVLDENLDSGLFQYLATSSIIDGFIRSDAAARDDELATLFVAASQQNLGSLDHKRRRAYAGQTMIFGDMSRLSARATRKGIASYVRCSDVMTIALIHGSS